MFEQQFYKQRILDSEPTLKLQKLQVAWAMPNHEALECPRPSCLLHRKASSDHCGLGIL